MRLSQIKIAGFKSFVDPAKILFPANITAVVGPNGCGKSNIIDAVRWVMGESSAKNLRGESMEDVIFSGSADRKPIGQASVELVFDNSAGRVQGEYAKYNEISVKRVATRAGQSKYFLNNSHCRRRDIADVFLGTGLGPRSYSIIEQGMVSRIIDAKPEDLRVYLEEAAGISKYKERRRETETRIRHTRENLDRLVDLIEEINKQLSRLDRQSKTAEKFKSLKQAQRRLHAESLLLQQAGFGRQIELQNQSLGKVETSMQENTAGLRETERKIEENHSQLTAARDRHNEFQSQYYRLGSDISSKEQAIEHQNSLRERSSQELLGIQNTLRESSQTLEQDRTRLQQLEGQIVDLKPEFETNQSLSQQQQSVLSEAESAMHLWQDLWDNFRRDYHQVHELAQIENRGIEHIERQISQSDQQRQRLQQELSGLESSDFNDQIAQLENAVEEKVQEHAATLALAEGGAGEIQQLRELSENQFNELSGQQNELQTLRGRLSSLEALQRHVLAESSDEVKAWLNENKVDSRRRLTDLLKVSDGNEKAVEVVLAPFLSAYCVETGGALPAQLIPDHHVALFDGTAAIATSTDRDWSRLVDYVDCEIDLSGLLNNVFLCSDDHQLSAMRQQLNSGESVVTKQGVWAGRNWVIQLGEEDQQSGMLERSKEIDQIQAQIARLAGTSMSLRSRYDGDRERLQQQEQKWDQDQKDLAELQWQLSDLRQQLSQLQSRNEQVVNRRQQLQKDLSEVDERKAAQALELESNSVKRNEFLQQIDAISNREGELQSQKLERQQSLGDARAALEQGQTLAHQLQIQLQSLQSDERAARANIERIEQQAGQFEQRINELESVIASAEEPILGLQATLQELLQARSHNELELKQAQQALGELDNYLRELEAERNQHQQLIEEVRNRLEQQRMQLQELKIHSKSILEQFAKTGFESVPLEQEMDSDADPDEWGKRLEAMEARIERLGPINLAAIEERAEQAERKEYLDAQHQDLTSALETLETAIRKIDHETKARFKETFDQVNDRMGERFPKLFGGGEAQLQMTENDLLKAGVQIMARPPGKRITNLQLLSGGEKALTAVALIFAIFDLNPSPFCMLDEVDAPLDDANVGRFSMMVKEMSEQVQFIMITHNKVTMEIAESLNGVTMYEPGVSRLVSVDVGDAIELAGA